MTFYVPLRDSKNEIFWRVLTGLLLAVAIVNCFSIAHKMFNGELTDSTIGYIFAIICLLVYVVMCPLLIMSFNTGLYINNGEICFKRVLKKHYSIDDFAGLIVLKAQFELRGGRHGNIKNKNGENEYSIVYLSRLSPKFTNHRDDDAAFDGDLDFITVYKDYVLFRTTYDERAIEFFESKNIPILNSKQV